MQVMAAYYIRIGGGNIWGNSAGVGCAVPLRYLICDFPKPCRMLPHISFCGAYACQSL